MSNEILSAENLSIGFTHPRRSPDIVAKNISVQLPAGELICLLGPNGVGKSTLLRTLAGMQQPLSGWVYLTGLNIHRLSPLQLARQVSVVLTERVDVGAMSVYELVALGRHPYTRWSGMLTEADEAIVREAIKMVSAVDLARRPVNELSDGERQKVMIARALAQEPTLLILDEPTAFLDLPRRVEMMRLLRRLAHTPDKKRAVLLSTHDLDLALRSADRVWLMSATGLLQVGAPEDLVLNGAFEATFRSEGVEFDVTTGSFKVNSQPGNTVWLKGQGVSAIWTMRALERIGLQVIHNCESSRDVTIQVEIIGQDVDPQWQLTMSHESYRYDSLYDLISFLRDWVL